ncbi:glycoside hydrolase family 73 protein [Clostridium rectalis]|uniref:glycoside hydrolase family 73 protein n=1 Tax=Clostridium rectalis TaxID=2040295 RepID=UPI000F63B485|nr:glucosaminidase domain-containing protein [Clostridium rectalis]
MCKKKKTCLITVLIIFSVAIYSLKILLNYKGVKIDVGYMKRCIEIADEVSYNSFQVNWKYLYAITLTVNKDELKKIKDQEIRSIANSFIVKNNDANKFKKSNYKLRSLDEVLTEMNIIDKQKDKVYKYMNKLENKALVNISVEQKEFINNLEKYAIEGYYNFGILPSITISQAILESGWGKSKLSIQANNIFGIKADKNFHGKSILMETKENYKDVIKDKFRSYNSPEESIKDYMNFLKENKRYKQNGVFDATHYTKQAKAIEKAGYSTIQNKKGDKVYSQMLIDIIKQYNLQLIDNKAQTYYFNK